MLASFNAGRLDVDTFLEEQGITSELFDEWMEMHASCPLGTEPLAWVIANCTATLASLLKPILESSLVGIKDVPMVKPEQLIYWHKPKRKRKREQHVSPNAGVLAVRAALGGQ